MLIGICSPLHDFEGAPDVADALRNVPDKVWRTCAGTGQLQSLQWTDLTCNSCGGPASKQCMVTKTSQPQHSCAGGLAAHTYYPFSPAFLCHLARAL